MKENLQIQPNRLAKYRTVNFNPIEKKLLKYNQKRIFQSGNQTDVHTKKMHLVHQLQKKKVEGSSENDQDLCWASLQKLEVEVTCLEYKCL